VKIDGHVCGSGAIKHREFAMASGEMTSQKFECLLAEALTLIAYTDPGAIIYACMDLAAYGRDARRRPRRSL
jgi:hypothetical protein